MGKNRALIIGVNEYEDQASFKNLKYAESDADSFYNVLINPDIGDFKEEDVIFLPGKATKSEVEESLESILSESGKDDLVVIYFAGHGKLDKSYSLCLATQHTKTDRLLSTSVHMGVLQRMIEQSDCKSILFFIDSCFSGAAGESSRGGETIPTKAIQEYAGEGKVFISASDAFQHAREKDALQHGIFTYHLVNALEGGEADLDGDGYVSIDELYKYVFDKVADETKRGQEPRKWGNVKGEVFVAKSIKNLEIKRLKIEILCKKAVTHEKEGKLCDAVDTWLDVLRQDLKNEDAPRKIQQIEEMYKPQRDVYIDKLYEYYDKETIIETMYNKAVDIMSHQYSKLNDNQKKFANIIVKFIDNLEVFIATWNREERKSAGRSAEAPGLAEMPTRKGEGLGGLGGSR